MSEPCLSVAWIWLYECIDESKYPKEKALPAMNKISEEIDKLKVNLDMYAERERELLSDWSQAQSTWQSQVASLKERERGLWQALDHLAHWAKDIAGDTDLPAQRDKEDKMMEWIDRVLAEDKEQS